MAKNQKTPLAVKSPIRPPQLRSVYLHDWWLIKVEAHSNAWRLGVAGFSSRMKLGIRVFCSSAITKKHDHVTLETADGITITLGGFINRFHTLQKGFPPEVCSYFLYGFPYNWEEYADQSSCEESINRSLDGFNISENDGTRDTLPISFDDLPVTRVRDLLITTTGPDYCAIMGIIFNDILRKCSDDSSTSHCEPSANLDEETACQVTPRRNERNANEQKRTEDGSISLTTQKKRKVPPKTPYQSNVSVEALSSSTRVATRSMTRARKSMNNELENHPITIMKCSLATSVSEPKGSTDNNGGTLRERSTSIVNLAAISTAEETAVTDTTRRSALRFNDTSSTAVVSAKPSEPMSATRDAPSRRKSVRLLGKKS